MEFEKLKNIKENKLLYALEKGIYLKLEEWDFLIKNSNLNEFNEKNTGNALILALQFNKSKKLNFEEKQWNYLIKNTNLKLLNKDNESPLLNFILNNKKENLKLTKENIDELIKNSDLNLFTNINKSNILISFIMKYEANQLSLTNEQWTYLIKNSNVNMLESLLKWNVLINAFHYNKSIQLSKSNWNLLLYKTNLKDKEISEWLLKEAFDSGVHLDEKQWNYLINSSYKDEQLSFNNLLSYQKNKNQLNLTNSNINNLIGNLNIKSLEIINLKNFGNFSNIKDISDIKNFLTEHINKNTENKELIKLLKNNKLGIYCLNNIDFEKNIIENSLLKELVIYHIENNWNVFQKYITLQLLNTIIKNNDILNISNDKLTNLIINKNYSLNKEIILNIFENNNLLKINKIQFSNIFEKYKRNFIYENERNELCISYLKNFKNQNIELKKDILKELIETISIDNDFFNLVIESPELINNVFEVIYNKNKFLMLLEKNKRNDLKEIPSIQKYLNEHESIKDKFLKKFKNFFLLNKKTMPLIENKINYEFIQQKINIVKNKNINKEINYSIQNIQHILIDLNNKNNTIINTELNSFYFITLNKILDNIILLEKKLNKENLDLINNNCEKIINQLYELKGEDKENLELKKISKLLELKKRI